ncbi:MAG: pantetheine-phosphate adenylyltransferase [Holdemanella sp.]|nr:pantetheine-phosphate adenylyltransferase [Holdemanella sp.]
MTIAAFCGSFDPVTNGHIDLIERSAKLFEKVIVFISPNSSKKESYTLDKRLHWLQEATKHIPNVECRVQHGLSVEACHSVNATVLIRGIRNGADLSYEQNMAEMNAYLDNKIETVCLLTKPKWMYVSSSNIKEYVKYGQDITPFVPEVVSKEILL